MTPPALLGRRPRRLLYLGTPVMAVPPLEALVAAGFEIGAVVTRIDKRRGRGTQLSPSPVKDAAQRLGIPVVHSVADGLALDPSQPFDPALDLGVVVAFGQLIKPDALAQLPMVNLHFSLLPRWRGAAPVERALLAGDDVTGVCLMQLEAGLDTGPVFARVEVPIASDATGESLRRELVDVGTRMLVDELCRGLRQPVPQAGEPTYAAKLSTDDLRLDWSRPAAERDRQIRLGGAWTLWRGQRFKVLAAAVVDPSASGDVLDGDVVGGLRLVTVQPEGKPPMPFESFARGARPQPGEQLGR